MSDEEDWFNQPPEPEPPKPAEVVAFPKRQRRRPEPGWKDKWQLSTSGAPLTNFINARIALDNHPKLVGLVRYDEMAGCVVTDRQPPTGE